jgi:hypothetical protein
LAGDIGAVLHDVYWAQVAHREVMACLRRKQERAPLYVRLRILKAVARLIRHHGSPAAADRALTPHLYRLPLGDRGAFWMSVAMSLRRRAAQGVCS